MKNICKIFVFLGCTWWPTYKQDYIVWYRERGLYTPLSYCTLYSTPAILLTQLKDYSLLTLIVKLMYIIHVLVIPIIVLYTRGGFPTIFQDFFMIHMRELNLNFSLFLIFTQEHFYVSVVFKF